jgi:O-antigen/teichoic acid export membrane protein
MKPLREILKHSAVYAVGQILTRVASVLLLPLYTHCLTPADYGIIAIIDLTSTILALMIGGGMLQAVTRFHFDSDTCEQQDRLWWTGLLWLVSASVIVLGPLWLIRGLLAGWLLGSEIPHGSHYFSLALATIFVQITGQFADGYLRVMKWSGSYVAISLARLLLNVAVNVWLLVGLQMEVEGLLLGNLLASIASTGTLLAIFAKTRGPIAFSVPLAGRMLRFSAPLLATAVLAMLMHEVDRFLLAALVSLEEVGVYSLAHKVAFAVNTLCLLPFQSIWSVAIYDVARLPDSDRAFARLFQWITSGLGILLLGAALTVNPVLPLLTPDAYGPAVDLVAVILLGFFVFGLQLQFEVPALLARRPGLLIPGSIAGVVTNVVSNSLLIPQLGLWGAAWTTVLTYSAFSFTTLFVCRRLHAIQYPWKTLAATVGGLCLSYVLLHSVLFPHIGRIAQMAVSTGCCLVWFVVLLGQPALAWWSTRGSESRPVSETTADGTPLPMSDRSDSRVATTGTVEVACKELVPT